VFCVRPARVALGTWLKARFDGAKIVMLDAPERVSTSPGFN
jgi:hypothetical protein